MANFCRGDFSSFSETGGRPSSAKRQRTFSFPHPTTSPANTFQSQSRQNVQGQGQGVSQWGRNQLASLPGSNVKEGGGSGQRGMGGASQSETLQQCQKTTIKELSPHQANTRLIGIVVMKRSIRSFPDKRNAGCQRYNFTFTLRDTPLDYINVTCWGSDIRYITKLHESFKACDVVQIVNGQILSKAGGESEERWNAWTPSPYQINVSETYSSLSLYSSGPGYTKLSSLAHAPLRPVSDCHTLSSITANGQKIDGTHVNILAAIRHVGKVKEMTSKTGKELKKCEVKLMDQDCSTFSLLIWDEEVIELAQTWTPRENIIFAVDVKISYDNYRNCLTAVCDQKTLVTTNPDCREAHQLYQFSQSVEISPELEEIKFDMGMASQDNIENISEVFKIEELKEKQERGSSIPWGTSGISSSEAKSFTGILFAYLTTLNITEDTGTVVCYRCSMCKYRAQPGATFCSNKNCPSASSGSLSSYGSTSSMTASDLAQKEEWDGLFSFEPHFNLLVSFSDCTGGIEGVWLAGHAASSILGLTPAEFLNSTDAERTALKNSLQLELFKVYFKSAVHQADQKKTPIKILSMSPADPKEIAAHMTIM